MIDARSFRELDILIEQSNFPDCVKSAYLRRSSHLFSEYVKIFDVITNMGERARSYPKEPPHWVLD